MEVCPHDSVFCLLCVLFIIALYKLVHWYFAGGVCRSGARLDGKTVVVTGANVGIGVETARDMAQRGARVILACRNLVLGNQAAANIRESTGNGNVEVYKLDLASLSSVRACAKRLLDREQRIDILINNAGVFFGPHDAKTADGFELHIGTNHLGHFLLTNLLLERIKQSAPARIVIVSSSAHHDVPSEFPDDVQSPMTGVHRLALYSRSKLANIIFAHQLSKRLKGSGVTAYSLDPGLVGTNVFRNVPIVYRVLTKLCYLLGFMKTTKEGAQTSIYCAVQKDIEQHSGKYFSEAHVMHHEVLLLQSLEKFVHSDCRVAAPSHPLAFNDDVSRKLWDLSEQMVGLR